MTVSSEPQTVVRFGVFEADLRAGDLRKKGTKVKIQDLPFRALGVLLSRPNEVVTREEFRQALWPQDVFVDFDRAISSAIKRLRDALGDPAENPVFIETIERQGYRWIAPTSAVPTSSTVTLLASDARKPELEPAVRSVAVPDRRISPPTFSFPSESSTSLFWPVSGKAAVPRRRALAMSVRSTPTTAWIWRKSIWELGLVSMEASAPKTKTPAVSLAFLALKDWLTKARAASCCGEGMLCERSSM